MTQIQDSSSSSSSIKEQQLQLRSRSLSLGCFGSSVSPKKVKDQSRKRNTKIATFSWFSWSKKSPKRTVPVDAATTEKLHQRKENLISMAKSSKKVSTRPQNLPAEGAVPSQIPAAVAEKPVHDKKNETRYENAHKIILKNTKSLNHLDSIMMEATCKKGVFKRICSTQDSSPEHKHEISPAAVLWHSASMPPASTRKKSVVKIGARDFKKDKSLGEKYTYAGKFDQFLWISIIFVTLIIMIVWGKLCAIFCTSAWLYCYPLLIRSKKNEPKVTKRNCSKSSNLDIDSEEYKKKVVLDGFLERSHRSNGVGIL